MGNFIKDICSNRSSEWLDGFEKGVWAFAHWKDGTQYVGTTGTLLKDVIADIDTFRHTLSKRAIAICTKDKY